MGKKITLADAAARARRHIRTVQNWAGAGYFTLFRDAETGRYLVDLDEFEQALQTNPKMRDGRKPFGGNVRVVALPVQAVSEPGQ